MLESKLSWAKPKLPWEMGMGIGIGMAMAMTMAMRIGDLYQSRSLASWVLNGLVIFVLLVLLGCFWNYTYVTLSFLGGSIAKKVLVRPTK